MSSLKTKESLAVTYRPKYLEDLIDQDELVNSLKGQFKSGALPRSILITGRTGSGKTSSARMIAHYINCEEFDKENCRPCGKCRYCEEVSRGIYPDVEEINFSEQRGIETVRSIINSIEYSAQSNAQVFILDEMQCITSAAQNAILKPLEEPPRGVVFILLTTDPQKLLDTVKNRCCQFQVKPVGTEVLANHLLSVFNKEIKRQGFPELKGLISNEAFLNIAAWSKGQVRQGLASLETLIFALKDASDNNKKLDLTNETTLKQFVSNQVDLPEIDFARYLIEGIYIGKLGPALATGLKLANPQNSSAQYIFEKLMHWHRATFFLFVDPKEQVPELREMGFADWRASLEAMAEEKDEDGTPTRRLMLTVSSASEVSLLLLELVEKLNAHVLKPEDLIVAYTIKMVAAVRKHKDRAYTRKEPFYKFNCEALLLDRKEGGS